MKRKACFMCAALILLCGCGKEEARAASVSNQQNVSDVIEDLASKQEEETNEQQPQESAEPETAPVPAIDESGVRLMNCSGNVDIDLTGMNANMIYSEVYNMMAEPDAYIGKTIRIYGMYTHHYEESSDRHYYACVVRDALACCASGLEFTLTDDYVWPDDYPPEGSEIVVAGVFEVYQDGYFKALNLSDAVIEKYTPNTEG